ncbi:MAG: hypothetical protein V7746_01730 [Halioglobus sp.]
MLLSNSTINVKTVATKITSGLTIACTTAALSGCSIGRVNDAKGQFCDFDNNFSYSLGEQPSLVWSSPVLRDSDVEGIIGYRPTKVIATENGLTHRYVVEKFTLDDAPAERMTFEINYQVSDDIARLQSIVFPSEMSRGNYIERFSDPTAIAASAAEICSSSFEFSMRPFEQDIDPKLLADLPDKEDILAMMGAPSWQSEDEHALIYEYHVLGQKPHSDPVRMVVWFDEADVMPVRMETRYRFMRSRADLREGKVRMSYGM